jgi:hypothetical protein
VLIFLIFCNGGGEVIELEVMSGVEDEWGDWVDKVKQVVFDAEAVFELLG